jgi:Zn-dependent peptidase ImmA (M78 family)
MLPEINLALRLIERRELTPPVDVLSLLGEFADISIISIPFDIDGVCIGLKVPGRIPKVIINKDRSDRRIRFTAAHELGHILIPWHTGLIIDQLDASRDETSKDYWRLELEANRFASELLVPSQWIRDISAKYTSPIDAAARVYKRAQVSYHMASIKLLRVLPAGYIHARIQDGFVISSGRSSGTYEAEPTARTFIDAERAYPHAVYAWHQIINGINYHWWLLDPDAHLEISISELWKTKLNLIIDDLNVDDGERPKFWGSVNGMIALANSRIKVGRNFNSLYSACMERLVKNSEKNPLLLDLIEHEDFIAFLKLRVSALLD